MLKHTIEAYCLRIYYERKSVITTPVKQTQGTMHWCFNFIFNKLEVTCVVDSDLHQNCSTSPCGWNSNTTCSEENICVCAVGFAEINGTCQPTTGTQIFALCVNAYTKSGQYIKSKINSMKMLNAFNVLPLAIQNEKSKRHNIQS